MSDLIKSSEFGDWLLGEMSAARKLSKSAQPDCALAAGERLQSLKVTKGVLLEFLTLQESMLQAASGALQQRTTPRTYTNRPASGWRAGAAS